MSSRISPHQIALACGTGGAYVDVTSYVEFDDGITYTYGRTDQFSDAAPGTFAFTLNNADGRFTPGNASSPLATKVTEGMGVSWLLGTRLVHTTILSLEIGTDDATWYRLRITCDDMLGTAGRQGLTNLPDDLTNACNPQLQWRLDEGSSAIAGSELNSSPLGQFAVTKNASRTAAPAVVFGQPQVEGLPGTAVTLTAAPGETNFFGTPHGNRIVRTNIAYPTPAGTASMDFGWWNIWVYPGSTCTFAVIPYWAVGAGYSDSMQVIFTPQSVTLKGGANAGTFTHMFTAAELTAPHRVSMHPNAVWQTSGSYWALFIDLWMDGTYLGQVSFESAVLAFTIPLALLTAGTAMQPVEVNVSIVNPSGATGSLSGTFQRISHTLNGSGIEDNALFNTEDQRRAVLDTLDPAISSAAYHGRPSLSTAPLGFPDISNRSILDVYNDIVRTEQGHLFCLTTGTLTAPVEQIQMRDRDRPTTVKAAFDITNELDGPPTFLRDITNVAESVDVAGPGETVTVADPTVKTISARAITAGLSETVLNANQGDLRLWGQDRINRGKNIGIRVPTFTVDAVTTPTDRSADLLGLVPGDRLQLQGIPAVIFGFGTWDGWLLGASENHTRESAQFALALAPVLPAPAVYDTDRYANAGAVTLAAAMSATDTTMTVTSTVGAVMSTDTPYTLTVGTSGEQVTVTSVAGNVLTVTRGANGTTAIAHTTSAPIEVYPVALYAF